MADNNNGERPTLPQTIMALLFGIFLQVAMSLIDLALKPIPLVVYFPVYNSCTAALRATLYET